MRFLYLWPFILLILIAVIILMYLLKQKAVDQPFSSLFLWREMYRNMEANTPWEKLKKNWLMILQIITLIVLILALASPYLLKGGSASGNVVIVIDNSAGMNNQWGDGRTRLEQAIEDATDYVQKLRAGTRITLFSVAEDAVLLISNSDEKSEVIERIKAIEPTVYAGNCVPAVEMIESMQAQWDEVETVYFTDTYVPLGNTTGYMVDMCTAVNNVGIEYVGHGKNGGQLTVLAKIVNYGTSEMTTDVNLYGGGNLLDLQTVTINAGESSIVYFENVPYEGDIIYVELTNQDDLLLDNTCYDILTEQEESNILLMTDSNLYLEKALALVDNVTVTKSNDIESFTEFANQDYDLYIFDGMVPSVLPTEGNMIFIGCKCPELYNVTETLQGVLVKTQERTITKYLEDYEFGVGQTYIYEVPTWGESFLETDDKCAGFIGLNQMQTICVIGFDFHNTDLPLKMEFPLMIYNIMSECVSSGMLSKNVVFPGNQVQVNGKLDGDLPMVTFPDETQKVLHDNVSGFSDTDMLGVYTITQKQKDTEKTAYIAVNFPTSENTINDIPANAADIDEGTVKTNVDVILELRSYVILAALLLLGAEWVFFLRR